jgi:PHS family inorganic phosphate transporter-like MFS transporter
MLGYVYGVKGELEVNQRLQAHIGALNTNQDLGVKVATPVGTLLGQLFFGFLADQVGRKRMYGVELMIIVVATFAQALLGSAASVNIIGAIVVWRGIVSQFLTPTIPPLIIILPCGREWGSVVTTRCQL